MPTIRYTKRISDKLRFSAKAQLVVNRPGREEARKQRIQSRATAIELNVALRAINHTLGPSVAVLSIQDGRMQVVYQI